MDVSGDRSAVEARLLAIAQALRQREQSRLKLASYSPADYKPGPAGIEMERLLLAISNEEHLALTELVLMRDDVAAHCRAAGAGDSVLSIVDDFFAFRSAKAITLGDSNSSHSYAFVSKTGDGPGKDIAIYDVRFFMKLGTRLFQVLEQVHDLLQFWEIFLRHHTTLDLEDFSSSIRAALLERVTDTVFYQPLERQLLPVSAPAPATASVQVLQSEIGQRLGNVAFYFEELELLRPALSKYTVRTFYDNKDAKRDATRIRNVETSLLHELINLTDSVRKWLEKQNRTPELAVIERLRPYRIGANLDNARKHGIRGRNQACAVVELERQAFVQSGNVASPDDRLLDVASLVNYEGELFPLTQIIEDISHLWELFLRYHTDLSLTDFQVRFGKVLLRKAGHKEFRALMPQGLVTWAQQEATRRKHLDLK